MTAIYREAEGMARRLRGELDLGPPPIDVSALALRLGVSKVVARSIQGDGRLETLAQDRVIVVDATAGKARQRFTIAHELGHFLLAREDIRTLDLQAQERFCNAFAAALLMPDDWLLSRTRESEPSLAELEAISRDASVSLASCLIRLQRFPRWRRALIRWQWDEGDWRLWSVVGLSAVSRSQISSVERTRRTLAVAQKLEPGAVLRCSLWLGIGEEERQLEAELTAQRGRALAFLKWLGEGGP